MPFPISRVSFGGFVVELELPVFWFDELAAVEGPAVTSSYAGGGSSIGAAIFALRLIW
jgi:hypothetical protein